MKLNDLFDLKGKVAIVTGGARGIGNFIATGLAEAGADVVVASRKLEKCEEAAAALKALGSKSMAVKCDLGSVEEIEALVDTVVAEYGTVDILVNNSGVTWGAPTLDFPLDKWEKVFDINVKGVWVLTQKTARIMKENGGGKIINISSIMASRGSSEMGHPAIPYNSSKAAIEVLTKNLAVKLADCNIHVNAIAPGFFRTDMMEYIFKPEFKAAHDATIAEIPLGRVGGEDEIKALAVFLASKASDFVTGAIIPVDGGQAAK
jgi:NAD(P)-dependent dehydrogenase (short-subunit alcohol dehydrogenase family)